MTPETLRRIDQAAASAAVTIAAVNAAAKAAALLRAIPGKAGEGHVQSSDRGGLA